MKELPVFSLHYLPCIEWLAEVCKHEQVLLDLQENYVKQSYRNRCYILSANGKMPLVVPILQPSGSKQKVANLHSDNETAWQRIHWQSLCSAYGKSAYFIYYKDAFEPFYTEPLRGSFTNWNIELLRLIFRLLKLKTELSFSDKYVEVLALQSDFRNRFLVKGQLPFSQTDNLHYMQVFSDKFPFERNLSIIDLLFNVGPDSLNYLKKISERGN